MNEMATFTRVVESGSFAHAAESLSLSPSAVSKIISRLEDRLRVKLLTRTTRKLALTVEGERYLEHAREILSAIEAAESEIAAARGKPSGVIRVNVGTAVGKHQLAPILGRFLEQYPEISVELSVTDRQIDIIAEQADVVLRTGALSDSSLQARKLTDSHRLICASPDYLARHGTPRVPADLLQHNCLLISRMPHLARWPFHTPEGINHLKVSGNLVVDNADILRDMAVRGLGIVRIGEVLVRSALARGTLVSLLEDVHAPETFPIWAVTPPGRARVHRIRLFIDYLAEAFRAGPSAFPVLPG